MKPNDVLCVAFKQALLSNVDIRSVKTPRTVSIGSDFQLTGPALPVSSSCAPQPLVQDPYELEDLHLFLPA